MIADTTRQFIDNEVVPRIDELEKHDWKLARQLVSKAAELGLIGANIPRNTADSGSIKRVAPSSVRTSGALLLLPRHSARKVASVCCRLSTSPPTPRSRSICRRSFGRIDHRLRADRSRLGSDAMAAKATARLSDDGKEYILNGEKMWITNGGFADIFIVFAKVDGDKFTAFIVERQPGLTSGAEEHKMGIKGSSTTALVLSDVRTPVENLLGEVGKGHKIAFNVLNIGRFKLGAMCVGGMKLMVHESVRYANERHQFGKPISSFGAIKAKLAEQAIRTWIGESMIYRTLGMIEAGVGAVDSKDMDALARDRRVCSRVFDHQSRAF